MYSLKGTLWQSLQKWRKTLQCVLSPPQINTFLCGYLVRKAWWDKGYITADSLPPIVFPPPGANEQLWKDWEVLYTRVKSLIGDHHEECSWTAVPMGEIISLYLQLQSPRRRQRLGAYYTPPPLVDFILEHTLVPCLSGVDPRRVTFLDPACGCGHFLTRAYDRLKTAYLEQGFTKAEVPFLILRDNIFGIDIDPWALQLAALVLIEKDRACWPLGGKLPLLRLFPGDALDKSGPLSSFFNRTFSVVAGNPPHVTNYARSSQGLEQEYIDALKPQYRFSRERTGNRYNLTMFFLERFLELLGKGGRAGIVVDGSGFQTTVYKEIREHIQARSLVRHIVAGLEVFPGVNNRQAILILEQSPGEKKTRGHRICYRKGLSGEVVKIPQDSPSQTWLRPISGEVSSLLAKIEAAGSPLEELFQPISGMNVTNRPGAGLKPFLAGEPLDSTYHKAIFSGNISPYILRWPTREQSQGRGRKKKYICYDRKLARAINYYLASQGLKSRVSIGKSDTRFRQEKLFVRQSLGGFRNIAAAYSADPEEYCDNSVYVINIHSPQYSLFYLLPILNSSLMTFYARESGILSAASRATATRLPMGSGRGRGLRNFPIPAISSDGQKTLIELATRLVFWGRKMAGAESGGKLNMAATILKKMEILRERVEERVFALYGLNQREVDLLYTRDRYGE